MSERRLKRQLGLAEVLMLGTAGTIAAELFVLTGHIAGRVGPAGVLVVLVVGLMCYTLALSYAELGTALPYAGGTLAWVHEAWGSGLLCFMVGTLDCFSSAFYASLSAVGFAYSVQVFLPSLPVVPVALAVVAVFTVLNLLGVSNVGRAQLVLGSVLMLLLGAYIVLGFTRPNGFSWQTFLPAGDAFFPAKGLGANLARLLNAMALIFNAYIGFEIIVDDAEEVQDPSRNVPRGVLISLGMITVIYVLATLVTYGTLPQARIAGSESALADAAGVFWPRWGPAMVALAGIIATLTSVNTAMLAATREAFTMARDGLWPRFLARLGARRTPWVASLMIGTITGLVAAIGLVEFLSYISSSGYLFVVFWASLALVHLRRTRPDLKRPFKVPLYPVTPFLAAGTALLVVVFTDWRPLLFLGGLLIVFAAIYFARRRLAMITTASLEALKPERHRILVPVVNAQTAAGLARLAVALAEHGEDTSITMLGVVPLSQRPLPAVADRFIRQLGRQQRQLLAQVAGNIEAHNIPFATKMVYASSIAEGILTEVGAHGGDRLILMGWPKSFTEAPTPVIEILKSAPADVALFLNRGLGQLRHILVPVGGGFHSRLAVRIACELAEREGARVTALFCLCEGACSTDDTYDKLLLLREVVESEMGAVPPYLALRVLVTPSVVDGLVAEWQRQPAELLVVGASVAAAAPGQPFGTVPDQVAARIPASILFVRRHESASMRWIRRQMKQLVTPQTEPAAEETHKD